MSTSPAEQHHKLTRRDLLIGTVAASGALALREAVARIPVRINISIEPAAGQTDPSKQVPQAATVQSPEPVKPTASATVTPAEAKPTEIQASTAPEAPTVNAEDSLATRSATPPPTEAPPPPTITDTNTPTVSPTAPLSPTGTPTPTVRPVTATTAPRPPSATPDAPKSTPTIIIKSTEAPKPDEIKIFQSNTLFLQIPYPANRFQNPDELSQSLKSIPQALQGYFYNMIQYQQFLEKMQDKRSPSRLVFGYTQTAPGKNSFSGYLDNSAQSIATALNLAISKNLTPDNKADYIPAYVSDKDGIVIDGQKTLVIRTRIPKTPATPTVLDLTHVALDVAYMNQPAYPWLAYNIALLSDPSVTVEQFARIRNEVLTNPQFKILNKAK